MKKLTIIIIFLFAFISVNAQTVEYFKAQGAGATWLTSTNWGYTLTTHNGIQSASIQVAYGGRNNNGDYVYTAMNVPYVFISSDRTVLSVFMLPTKYTRCTQAEAEQSIMDAAAFSNKVSAITGQYNSGYSSNNSSDNSQFSFVKSVTAYKLTVVDASVTDTSYESVSIYKRNYDGAYVVKVGSKAPSPIHRNTDYSFLNVNVGSYNHWTMEVAYNVQYYYYFNY